MPLNYYNNSKNLGKKTKQLESLFDFILKEK
jgi:hypothetical protein